MRDQNLHGSACPHFKTVVIKFFNRLICYHGNKTDISKDQGKLH